MMKLNKTLALLLCVCLMASGAVALAESTDATQTVTDVATDEVTTAVATTIQLNDTDVVARINGTDVTGAEVKSVYTDLVNSYGEPDETMLELYYAVAMEQAATMKLIALTAAEKGLDQYTDEELAAVYAESDASWQSALDNYVQSSGTVTETSTDAEKTSAYSAAEAYYAGLGYTKDLLRTNYLESSTYQRVEDFVCKDITVSDEAVQTKYDENVATDKALYENDLDAYESQMMMYQQQYVTEKPWYHPAGYRYIKHILLSVDATLLANYNDLQARLEEQMDSESTEATATDTAADATADPSATPEPTQEPVTQADVDNAKADILASLQDKITAINDKIAAGTDFDALITEYAVDADGNATDVGMTNGTYPSGYEVSMASASFVPEFVEAAFSVSQVGDVSAPYISQYGVHIVKYVSDVPAGAVELTDDVKTSIRTTLETSLRDAAMTAWHDAASIEYTGILKTIDEIQVDEAADTTDTDTTTAEATAAPEETVAEVTAAPAQ